MMSIIHKSSSPVKEDWAQVTRDNLCPICGKPDWCATSTDGIWTCCRRVDTGEGKHKVDRSGADYWVYRLDGQPLSATFERTFPLPTTTAKADRDTLHSVYTFLLSLLKLSKKHLLRINPIMRKGRRCPFPGSKNRPDRTRRTPGTPLPRAGRRGSEHARCGSPPS